MFFFGVADGSFIPGESSIIPHFFLSANLVSTKDN